MRKLHACGNLAIGRHIRLDWRFVMLLKDIKPQDVIDGKCWLLDAGEELSEESKINEAVGFTNGDVGLLSAVIKLADYSEHLALVVQSFLDDGDETDLFIHTKNGWMDIQTDGIHRSLGKYNHEMFPFDYFLATQWLGGKAPAPDKASDHTRTFRDPARDVRSWR